MGRALVGKPPIDVKKNQASPQNTKLAKTERLVEQTNEKLEKAREKLPAKKNFRSERIFNKETGKAERKLYFEKEIKPQNEHLRGALPLRPVKSGNSSKGTISVC